MMIPIKLRKITSTHNNLRTAEVIGQAPRLPVIGERFIVYSEALEIEGGVRYVTTSPVQSVDDNQFTTANSTYELTQLEEACGV